MGHIDDMGILCASKNYIKGIAITGRYACLLVTFYCWNHSQDNIIVVEVLALVG